MGGMAVRKRDRSFVWRHFLTTLLFAVPLVATLIWVFNSWPIPPSQFITAFAGTLAWLVLGFSLQVRRFSRYRCPDCKKLCGRERYQIGDPLEFYCQDCNTIWTTGFMRGSE